MSTPARKRLMRDFRRLKADPPQGVDASPNPDNIMQWSAVILGPEDTSWDGGTFKLKLVFAEDYPNKPPSVTFVCPMFHPNVYPDTGVICLDILQKNWSPIYDVAAVLTSVQSLLCDPNCTSPANAEAAKLFMDSRREYNKRVKEVVEKSWIHDSSAEDAEASAGQGDANEAAPAVEDAAAPPKPEAAVAASAVTREMEQPAAVTNGT